MATCKENISLISLEGDLSARLTLRYLYIQRYTSLMEKTLKFSAIHLFFSGPYIILVQDSDRNVFIYTDAQRKSIRTCRNLVSNFCDFLGKILDCINHFANSLPLITKDRSHFFYLYYLSEHFSRSILRLFSDVIPS